MDGSAGPGKYASLIQTTVQRNVYDDAGTGVDDQFAALIVLDGVPTFPVEDPSRETAG